MRKIPSWDQYFIMQAIIASTRSKDPSRQVGCVIVDKNNRQISMGYNGFIAKVDEKKFTWDKGDHLPYSKTKYAYVLHAEQNAILHANKSLKNGTLYVTLFPCNECAKFIASKGIKRVVYLQDNNVNSESGIASLKILKAAGIKLKKIKISKKYKKRIKEAISLFDNN